MSTADPRSVPGLPRLVTVAHGTRRGRGNLLARRVTAAAARRLGVPGTASYVELCAPRFSTVMADNRDPVVVVPLLLSAGHHVNRDLPEAMAASPAPVRSEGPLGPHPLLARVMADRLLGCGARTGDPVVVVAAGSREPDAASDLAEAARLLRRIWGGPVHVGAASGPGRDVTAAVQRAAMAGQVAVVPYLGAPGHFSERVAHQARVAGARRVADVLGAHPLVVELVVRRYRAALGACRDVAVTPPP